MTMKRSRIVSAILAFLTILCGAALKIFRNFPPFLRIEIAILAILLHVRKSVCTAMSRLADCSDHHCRRDRIADCKFSLGTYHVRAKRPGKKPAATRLS